VLQTAGVAHIAQSLELNAWPVLPPPVLWCWGIVLQTMGVAQMAQSLEPKLWVLAPPVLPPAEEVEMIATEDVEIGGTIGPTNGKLGRCPPPA